MANHDITFRYLSQEALIEAGAFNMPMAIGAVKRSLTQFKNGDILFPEKIVQEFDDTYKARINCLPASWQT